MPWRAPYRFWRHAFGDEADVRRAFPPDGMARIERSIREGEATHGGQVCVAVEPALPLARVIAKLADRDVEIVADRGIDRRVGHAAWEEVCQRMEAIFRDGRHVEAVEAGVREVSALLALHFPGDGKDRNELPDRPVVL